MTRKLVVGLDGSADSTAGLRWATELAEALGAEIVAVHVLGGRPLGESRREGPVAERPVEWRLAEQHLMGDWSALCRERGVPYHTRLIHGHPVTQLINIALEEGAMMIVVGSRGLDGFSELLLGSVSHQLTQHSPVPVLVVRRPPEATKAQRDFASDGSTATVLPSCPAEPPPASMLTSSAPGAATA